MELNDRKKMILQAIIDEYIGSAEPVGSRAISKKNTLGLSSATIRNEMADLEEMGFLIQPHTSAGRIPSDAGYRFYVNSLMRRYEMGVEAIENLQKELVDRINRLDRAIVRAGYLTAALTDYTTFITTPSDELAEIKKIDLVSLSEDSVMLIVVTRTVKSRQVKAAITSEQCAAVAAVLNSVLAGKTANSVTYETIREIEAVCETKLGISPRPMMNILNTLQEIIRLLDDSEIYIENVKSILKYPEYRDVDKAREIFSFLEDKNNIKKLIVGPDSNTDGVLAKIGKENEPEILKDCSLVTVNYSLDGKTNGKIGVIGPKRMNYSQVFASLDLISQEIDKLIGYISDDV